MPKEPTDEKNISKKKSTKTQESRISFFSRWIKEVIGTSIGQYQTEEEYAEAIRHYYESIIACMPGNVYWMNKNLVYLGCNDNVANFLRLKSRLEVIGKTYDEMSSLAGWSAGQGQSFKKDDIDVITSGKPKLGVEEPPVIGPDNKTIYYLTSRVPIKDKHGNVTGVVGISIDITERKRLEEDLRHSQIAAEAASRAKSEFIANISHDIRTPLTGIIGMAQKLNKILQGTEEKRQVTNLHKSGERLLELLNGVLETISAENLREDEIIEKSFDLRELLESLIELEAPKIELKNLKFHVALDNNLPQFVVSDPQKLRRILLNLLGNAIKFTKKGSVTLQTKLLSKENNQYQIEFSVIDTGIGIAEELHNKVFEQFFRAKPSYKSHRQESGLGLSIVKKYVSLLGGQIKLISQLNQGSKFYFVLSLSEGKGKTVNYLDKNPTVIKNMIAEPEFIKYAENSQKKIHSPHILLVDDDAICMESAEAILQELHCTVKKAENAEIAIKMAKTEKFDLILTDVGLPGISGDEMAVLIRYMEKSSGKKSIPIIGLTGHVENKDAVEAMLAAGINDIVIKPANQTIISEILCKYLG